MSVTFWFSYITVTEIHIIIQYCNFISVPGDVRINTLPNRQKIVVLLWCGYNYRTLHTPFLIETHRAKSRLDGLCLIIFHYRDRKVQISLMCYRRP